MATGAPNARLGRQSGATAGFSAKKRPRGQDGDHGRRRGAAHSAQHPRRTVSDPLTAPLKWLESTLPLNGGGCDLTLDKVQLGTTATYHGPPEQARNSWLRRPRLCRRSETPWQHRSLLRVVRIASRSSARAITPLLAAHRSAAATRPAGSNSRKCGSPPNCFYPFTFPITGSSVSRMSPNAALGVDRSSSGIALSFAAGLRCM
jgi:hypothetical protein